MFAIIEVPPVTIDTHRTQGTICFRNAVVYRVQALLKSEGAHDSDKSQIRNGSARLQYQVHVSSVPV